MSNEPTELTDLAEVTTVADILINGDRLWVSPGVTPTGRYWALMTEADLHAGLVIERADGTYAAVLTSATVAAGSAQEAARAVVAALRGAR